MKMRAVIFDLDGTLLDTLDDIADSANTVLARRGYPTHPVDDFRYFVGDGVRMLMYRVLPESERSDELVDLCVSEMREEYGRNWNVKTKAYPGVPDMLNGLANLRVKLAVLSNKPDLYTKKCVDALIPGVEFDVVLGQTADVPQKPDPAGALDVALRLSVTPERTMLVGDSDVDMKTAVAAGMYPVGVLWGFRSGKELREAGARVLLERPERLFDLLDSRDAS